MDQKSAEEKEFFEEVEEDLKYKRFYALWNQYGKYFISALGVALVFSVANLLWTGHMKSSMEKLTDHYMETSRSIENGDYETSLKQLTHLEGEGNDGFRTLVRLQKAYALELIHDKTPGREDEFAGKIYDAYASIQQDSNAPKFYKEMTSLVVAHGPFPQQHKPEVIKRLEALATPNGQWYHLALEALMVQYAIDKNFGKMKEIATQLKNDMKVSKSILQKAEAILEKLDASEIPVSLEKGKVVIAKVPPLKVK